MPGQMRRVLWLVLFLANSKEMLAQGRKKKPVSAAMFENCTGCVMCSEDNGCVSCQQRLFLLIWRDGIRQYGACVHACPLGYYGQRSMEVNRCMKCRSPSCESCFSKDFCMKCQERFYLHKGKCLNTCPPDTMAWQSSRECQENCEAAPWSNWSPCTNQGRMCGRKWGSEIRVRETLRSGKDEAALCPVLSESRNCRLKRHCPGEKNENMRRNKKERQERRRKKLIDAFKVA
ncbi:R-spondin-4 [Pantherophis guttatus]|uniref:R-spondin-4 n=1 Tax=Pantherophis guttatus TaxID=94885 RepID=A0ABM3YZI0_PANGU|nr:R-spondin-4 [Pantherophis guttatus]